jgi:hypothetical protein
MNIDKYSLCRQIVAWFEDMRVTSYDFKTPIIAQSLDGNKYTITGIDRNETLSDYGDLVLRVKTDWLYDAAIDIDGFNTDVVKSILEALPVKFIVRVSAHFGFNGQEKDFTIHEEEVDADCIIEDWAEENFPKLDWIKDDQDQVVCYSSEGEANYLLATIIPRFEE